jgi:cytochrome c oxidase assembly protein subunit 15
MENIQLNKLFKVWHLTVIVLLLLLVSIGGITRLTNSGLSITKWQLFTGILPPLNAEKWNEYFSLYTKIPQYNELNMGMSLGEFKYIFWWEYIHRLLARIVGLAYMLPLIFFIIKKHIHSNNFFYYFIIFFLFLFQGFLGWFMVSSGLTDNADVSHFRLAAHLSVAFLILGLIFWSYLNTDNSNLSINFSWSMVFMILFLFLFFVQIVFGAFTSGLDAGLIYQTWPKMNLNYFPEEVTVKSFFSKELLFDRAHIQLFHRLNAYLIFIIFLIFYIVNLSSIKKNIFYTNLLMTFLLIQIILGIVTLTSGVNIYLAALHQLTSVFLMMTILMMMYKLKS